jgi:glycine dehydrogenase subunit 1
MGTFIPNTDKQRTEILEEMGKSSINELFSNIPGECLIKDGYMIPKGISEMEVLDHMKKVGKENKVYEKVLRGAGAYKHFIPSTVTSISAKEEFLTAYTPYQGEISQGILQSIFEYQTMICEITGMDVSNASVYDGATAAAEAVNMCVDNKHRTILVSDGVDKRILETIKTYNLGKDTNIKQIPMKDGQTDLVSLEKTIRDGDACLLIQHPNYYGVLEDVDEIEKIVHQSNVKLIMSCYPISLGILKTPGEYGADIAVGEGQPMGLSMAYGGPYLGFMAAKKSMFRKLPGRIVGQTLDNKGETGYVLTLQAREQHIRREKAGSNICSNQAHCALRVAIYLATLGKEGFKDVAVQCSSKASYFHKELAKEGILLAYDKPFFNEFTTICEKRDEILERLDESNILGGLPLEEDKIIWCVTEMISKNDMDHVISIIKEVRDEFDI